jgi:multisubunit Na+/H+ antiporter MnhC subunit
VVEQTSEWRPDPFGVHELRYFSGDQPTNVIRDGDQEGYDAPPLGTGSELGVGQPPKIHGTNPPSLSSEAESPIGEPQEGAETRIPFGTAYDLPIPSAQNRAKSRGVVGILAAVVIIVAVVVSVALVSRSPAVPGAGIAPAAFVMSATQTTLEHRTADLIISGSVSASGKTVPLEGTGETDLTAGDFVADITASSAGKSLVERELIVDGHFYLGMTENGTNISTILAGKHWIDMPVPIADTTGSLGTGTVDPLNQLQLLTKHGNAVRPLGTSVIAGVTVSGYSITPSRQTIDQGIQSEISSGNLSPAEQEQLRQAARSFTAFTMDVWFDSSGLMQRMKVNIGTSTTSGSVIMTFKDYGTPVNVSPPAPGDVISYSAFMTAVQSAEATQS